MAAAFSGSQPGGHFLGAIFFRTHLSRSREEPGRSRRYRLLHSPALRFRRERGVVFPPPRAGDGGTLPPRRLSPARAATRQVPATRAWRRRAGRSDRGTTSSAASTPRSLRRPADALARSAGWFRVRPARFPAAISAVTPRRFSPRRLRSGRVTRASWVSVVAMPRERACPGATTLPQQQHGLVQRRRRLAPLRNGRATSALLFRRLAKRAHVSRSAASCVRRWRASRPPLRDERAGHAEPATLAGAPRMSLSVALLEESPTHQAVDHPEIEFRRPKNWSAEPFTQSVGTSRRHREPNRPRGGGAGEEDVDREGPRSTSGTFGRESRPRAARRRVAPEIDPPSPVRLLFQRFDSS